MQDLEMKDRIASDGKWRTRKKPLYTSHIESTEQSSMFRRNKNNYSCKRRRRVASNPVVTVLCIKLDAECDRQATVVGRLLTTLGDDRRPAATLFLVQRLGRSSSIRLPFRPQEKLCVYLRYRFRFIASYLSKDAILTYLTWGDPFRISPRSLVSEKQSPCSIVWLCLRDPMFSHFDTIPACDGQTDGRTLNDSKYRASIVLRSKNHTAKLHDFFCMLPTSVIPSSSDGVAISFSCFVDDVMFYAVVLWRVMRIP